MRRDFKKYSALDMEFIGSSDYEVRRFMVMILRKYINISNIKSDKIIEHFIEHFQHPDIPPSNLNDAYVIPHYCRDSECLGIGYSIMYIRLRSDVIDKLINDDGVVNYVKEWCKRKVGYEGEGCINEEEEDEEVIW